MIKVYRAKRTPLADAHRVLVMGTFMSTDLMTDIFGRSLDQLISKEAAKFLPPGPFRVKPRRWGSFMYETAAIIYYMWREFRRYLSLEEVLYAFGIRSVRVDTAGLEKARKSMIESLELDLKTAKGPEEIEECKRRLARAKAATSLDELFELAKEAEWDLYCAAYGLIEVFIKVKFEEAPPPVAIPSHVPVANLLAIEEDNYPTGVLCALAKEFDFIVDEASFYDFST